MTIVNCPAGCGGAIDTTKDERCASCRYPPNMQRIKVDPDWCWQWFGPTFHRMKCRRRVGHGGEHCEHSDGDYPNVSTFAGGRFEYEMGADGQFYVISETETSPTPDGVLVEDRRNNISELTLISGEGRHQMGEKHLTDDYVAWLRWAGDTNHRHLVLCDSDSEGAFRVYRSGVESLLLTCPFTGAKWRFHTQEQADMIQKSLDVHVTALTAERDNQYEFNLGQIARIAELEAERDELRGRLVEANEHLQEYYTDMTQVRGELQRVREENARLKAKVSDEEGWLIERGGLCIGMECNTAAWVTFTNPRAIRFSRKEDAENMLISLRSFGHGKAFHDCIVTGHTWVAARSNPPETPLD